MSLTNALLFLAFFLANLAIAGTTLFLSSSVDTLLTQRHPDVWRSMQGYSFAAREARTRFFLSRAPYRLNDAELSQAMTRCWLGNGAWCAFMLLSVIVMALRS
jgi:hypothetical protein